MDYLALTYFYDYKTDGIHKPVEEFKGNSLNYIKKNQAHIFNDEGNVWASSIYTQHLCCNLFLLGGIHIFMEADDLSIPNRINVDPVQIKFFLGRFVSTQKFPHNDHFVPF